MSEKVIIGADVGTTGCRAVVYRADGTVIAGRSREYALYTPQPGWAEQDAEEIYRALTATVREALAAAALPAGTQASMCFSTFFHSIMPVDEAGQPLYRLLIWADTRGQRYVERIGRERDERAIYARTGCMLSPQYPLVKIMWFKEERPDIFRRTARFVSIKEYILFRMLGRFVVDRSIASGTGLYDIHAWRWDPELLELLGLRPEQLSPVFPTTHIETGLTPEATAAMGVPPSLPVVLGAGDGALSNLGAGAVSPGRVAAMVGTSGAVRTVKAAPYVHPECLTWCYNLTDRHWLAGVAMNSGGIALRWVRDTLGEPEKEAARAKGGDAYDLLTAMAATVPAGAEGLVALPFLAGERATLWSARARGVFFGLGLSHTRAHLVRAMLEGVMFCLYGIYRPVREAAGEVSGVRAAGSFSRSPLWLQIMADVFNQPVEVAAEPTGSVYGAALLGLYAQGLIPDLDAAAGLVKAAARYEPDAANHRVYREQYRLFEELAAKLAPEFAAVAKLQEKKA
jgi:gluconokinase